ncbi:MAG: undecaprenyl-diphosphate phosphatase [Oceanococcus sp.]
MDALQIAVLALIQGITEFLPISSSAHLILVPIFTGWKDQGIAFDLATHVGTLLAVVVYFRKDVLGLCSDSLSAFRQRQHVGQSRLALSLCLGTIPAALVGLLLLDLIENQLRAVVVIFTTTIVFALLLGWADRHGARNRSVEQMIWRDTLIIGLAQALALVPGTSRSGVTITAGLMLGLTRQAASRFSFLLAIPITALAAASKLLALPGSDQVVQWGALFAGGIGSFVVAWMAIHVFLKLLDRFGLWPYVVYRLLLAIVLLPFIL